MKIKSVLLVAVSAMASISSPTTASAALTGTPVTGSLTVDPGFTLTTPFPAVALVSPATEFAGAFRDNFFNQNFTITANISDTDLLIAFASPTSNSANVSAGRAIASVSFGSALGLFTPNGTFTRVGCSTFCNDARAPFTFSADANTISAGFSSIYAGDVYRLALTSSVPEPATWAMMIAGFGLVGGAMRRRSTKIAFA